MKELLINYPHGLGDCIMLTPTLRQYNKITGKKVNLIMLKRLESAELFKHCEYVDKIFYVKDPWHDYVGGFGVGKGEELKEASIIAKNNNMNLLHIEHPAPEHKIIICANKMGIKLESTKMDIFIGENDKLIADKIIKNNVGNNPYGFIQTITTGGSVKDMPEGFGQKWLKKHKNLDHYIEVGKTFKFGEYNINVQFELMRRSKVVCLPDSVFYHACIAMEKNVDFVYFGRGVGVYERVKNLNKNVKENLTYKIPNI